MPVLKRLLQKRSKPRSSGGAGASYPTDNSIVTDHDTVPNFAKNATILSAQTGNWSNASTWDLNRVPEAGDIVGIKTTHTVTYDEDTTTEYEAVGIAGTLDFTTSSDTQLWTQHLLVYNTGELLIGTSGSPLPATRTAEIVLTDVAIDTGDDPGQFSNGFLSWGTVHLYGHPRTLFRRPTTEPASGNTSITLSSSPSGWQVGDTLYIADSRGIASIPDRIENPTVASVSGATVTFNSALTYDHPGMRDKDNVLERTPHIGNITRNIIIRSENGAGTRGHCQFFDRADIKIYHSEFRNLGRTTVQLLDPDTNHIGRYPLHIHHLTGPVDTGQTYQYELVGNVIQDTATYTRSLQIQGFPYLSTQIIKWGITVHDSHWGLIQSNFVRNYAGWGIGTEQGNERENIFDGNWVAEITGMPDGFKNESERELNNPPEWGHAGSGFWLAGPLSRVNNNVVTNCSPRCYVPFMIERGGGPITYPNTQGVPADEDGTEASLIDLALVEWNNNEAYGNVKEANNPWRIGALSENEFSNVITESIIDNECHWGVLEIGFFRYPTRNLTIRNYTARGGEGSNLSTGIGQVDYTQSGMIIDGADIQKFDIGIGAVTKQRNQSGNNGDMLITNCFLANKWNFYRTLMNGVSYIYEPRKITIQDTEMVNYTGRGTPAYDIYQVFPQSGSLTSDYTSVQNSNPVMPDILDLSNVSLNGDVVTGRVYFNDAQEGASLVPVIATPTLSGSITGATNTNPIVITSTNHAVFSNVPVRITGVGGNTAANGTFIATRLGLNTFSIPVTGNGAYTSGGTWEVIRGHTSSTKSNTDSLAQDGFCICGEITPGTATTHSRIREGKINES